MPTIPLKTVVKCACVWKPTLRATSTRAFGVTATKRQTGYAKFDLSSPSPDVEAMHDDASKTAAACCTPAAGLPEKDNPVQLGKKSGCC